MTSMNDQKLVSQVEQEELFEKCTAKIQEAGCDAAIALDLANIAYATHMVFPFAEQYAEPRLGMIIFADSSKTPILSVPAEWSQLVDQQAWQGARIMYAVEDGLYPYGLLMRLVETLKEAGYSNAALGFEQESIPHTVLSYLKAALPEARFVPLDQAWRELRIIKNPAEVRMLEEAARQADRALVSALNHSEGCAQDQLSYSLWEFTERIRVHVGEFGGSATGQVATMQGEDMRFFTKIPEGVMKPGKPLRAEFTNHHLGFWACGARTLHVGQPSPEFRHAYHQNISLKRTALGLLRPGAVCSDLYETVFQEAKKAGTDLWVEVGLGHGIGRSEREAPYLCPGDHTILQPGMVLVLSVYTHAPGGEKICSKDTILITEDGYRLLSWYRDWDSKIYALVGITARHG